jgi:hypothetical protein
MTPELFGSWMLQVAMMLCVVAGLAMTIVAVRTGWILKAIAWTTLGFGATGAVMILAPKWTEVVFEYKDFKARIAELEDANATLVAQATNYQKQIASLETGLPDPEGAIFAEFTGSIREKLAAQGIHVEQAKIDTAVKSAFSSTAEDFQMDYKQTPYIEESPNVPRLEQGGPYKQVVPN